MIAIEIPFEPVPWAAPQYAHRHVYDKREADKRAIRYLVREQYKGPVLNEYVFLEFLFGISIPKSTSKKNRMLMLVHEIIPTRCDCTNLQKLFEDCLKGIVIKDDRMAEIVLSAKIYSEKPFMNVQVHTRRDRKEKMAGMGQLCG